MMLCAEALRDRTLMHRSAIPFVEVLSIGY